MGMIIKIPHKVGTLMRLLIPAEMALHEYQRSSSTLDRMRFAGALQLIWRLRVTAKQGNSREQFEPLLRSLSDTYYRYWPQVDDIEEMEKNARVLMFNSDYISLLAIEAAAEALHARLSTQSGTGADFDQRRASSLLGLLRNWVSAHPNPNLIAQGEDHLNTKAGIASLTRMRAMYQEQVKKARPDDSPAP